MDDAAEPRGAKRSRFDQTEPEPKRASRFDRRSRSPPTRKPDQTRTRSPLSRDRETSEPSADIEPKRLDPAAAAAAVAARISEQLQSRGATVASRASPDAGTASSRTGADAVRQPIAQGPAKATSSVSAANINGEIYMSDGDYIKDIEVNDLRNRYLVTKASTQKMIKEETGADVTTRGSYLPDKSMASASNPPLYLHVTSTSKEGLEKALTKIDELINQELPQLVDERRFRRRDRDEDQQQRPQVERDEFGRKKWPDKQIPLDLEPLPGFNIRAQVVGHGGAYVKHIQQETGCRVQIKGRGSGFIESSTGRESDEPMFLHVTGPDADMVIKAKELCEDLLENVREQYESFKSRPQRPYGYGGPPGSYGGGSGGYGGGRGGYNNGYGGRGGGYNGGFNGGYGGHGPGQGPPAGPSGGGGGGYNSPSHGAAGLTPPTGPAAQRNISPVPAGTPTSASAEAAAPGATAVAADGATNAADYAAQYAQYYGSSDPYAAYGGYAGYVQYYQYYAAAQQAQAQQQQSPSQPPPPGTAAAGSPPPPPPSEAQPPPPPGPPPPGASGYNAVPPPPGL